MDYTRPELTPEEKHQCNIDAKELIRKYGMGKVFVIIDALVIENVRLTKEINEHRAARGIDPLKTYKV